MQALTMTPNTPSFGGARPEPFCAFDLDAANLFVPRFYGFARWGEAEVSALSDGQPLNDVFFEGELNSIQQEATADTVAQLRRAPHGAILVLPCGYGKTVCALFVAQSLGRRTLILVHKSFLVLQWQERIRHFLPRASIGRIQQDAVDFDADFVVGMVQSMSKREYDTSLLRNFGTVVVDEAHHMSAPVFSQALRKLHCKHVLGLTATLERKDGLTLLLHHTMGAVAHRIEREPEHTMVSCMLYEGGARDEITMRSGKVSMPLMITALATDPDRNLLISRHVARLLARGRYVIVLSDRVSQLERLMTLLVQGGVDAEDAAYYIGTTKPAERECACARRCILSTYSMANEGLDIPRLDTLVMATPKGDIVQASGRVQRKHPEKQVPLIVDVVDTFSVFQALRWKRRNFYRKQGFTCQSYLIEDAAPWFQ